MKVFLTALLSLAIPVLAQTPAQLKQELKTKEAAAKKDPDAIVEAAKWASEKGLAAEAKRLYQAALKLKPDHEGANLASGNALFEGKWLPAKEAEVLRKKAEALAYAAKGLIDAGGVWVEKEHAADAKLGIFHHEKDLVTKDEKIALMRGMVRHPDTDELIDPKFLEKAQNHFYPIGTEGRWVDEKEADKYHSDAKRPWIVRSAYCTLVGNLPLAKMIELKPIADRGFETASVVLGTLRPRPGTRPVIQIAETIEKYQEFGAALSDGTDAAGAFLAREEARIRIPMVGEVRPVIYYNEKNLGPYYMRHAAAMAAVQGVAQDVGAELPLWFLQAVGGLASRFENERDAGWFGQQQMQRGGIGNLKAFFAGYAINGEMEPSAVSGNIFLAGLMLSFASAKDADPAAQAALQAVTAALAEPGKGAKVGATIDKLSTMLIASEAKITAHLQRLLASAPK